MSEIKKELIEKLKIAIIYGENSVDGVNKEGMMEKIYKDEEDTAHYFYMLDFLKTHFKDEILANKYHDVNSIFYEIQKLGHIIFAESTSTPKYKMGIFYIPQSISDKQKQTLRIMQKQLQEEDYNIIEFFNLRRAEDGVLVGNQLQGKANVLDRLVDEEELEL